MIVLQVYIIISIVVLIAIILLINIYSKQINNKIKNSIVKIIDVACKNKGIIDYRLDTVKKSTHDFYLETNNSIYYIKLIYNFKNYEICINNSTKWQIRRSNSSESQMKFVEGVDDLMRLDLPKSGKKNYKLYIIYPNTKALLKVINECEMVFVYPDTDIYGTNVVTYKQLVEDVDLLDL